MGRLAGVVPPAVQQVREYDLVTPAGSPMTSPGSLAGDMNALAGGDGGAPHPPAKSPLGPPGGGAMAAGDGVSSGGSGGMSVAFDRGASGVSAEAAEWAVRQTPTLSAGRSRLSLPGTLSRAFSTDTEGTVAAAAAVTSLLADAGGGADGKLNGAVGPGQPARGVSADGSSRIGAAAIAVDQSQPSPPPEGLARSLVKQRSLPVPDRAAAGRPNGLQPPLQPLPLGALPPCTRSARYSLPGQGLVAAAAVAAAAAAGARESYSGALGPLERRIAAGEGGLPPPVQSAVEQVRLCALPCTPVLPINKKIRISSLLRSLLTSPIPSLSARAHCRVATWQGFVAVAVHEMYLTRRPWTYQYGMPVPYPLATQPSSHVGCGAAALAPAPPPSFLPLPVGHRLRTPQLPKGCGPAVATRAGERRCRRYDNRTAERRSGAVRHAVYPG